jgi:hypothetical protein
MFEASIRPVTRLLGVALTFAAAVLCIPTPGFAGPIVFMTDIFGAPDNDGRGAYSEDAQQGDRLAILHDDRREWARMALASPANRLSAHRGLGWDHEDLERSDRARGLGWNHVQFERSDRARGRDRSVGRGASGTGVPTPVPEPNTLILLGYGVVGAAMWTRRRIGAGRS